MFQPLNIGGGAIGGGRLSGTKIASQNRSDHGGRKRARNPLQKLQGFFASPAANKKQLLATLGVALKIAGSSQRQLPQVAAAAQFRGDTKVVDFHQNNLGRWSAFAANNR